MADNEPITKVSAHEAITDWRTISNTTIDKRSWRNRTDVTAATHAVDETGLDQLIYVDATSNVVSIELPASADVDGMTLVVYVKDSSNTVTITRDGTDTINQVGSNPTPTAGTGRVLTSLGDGDWLMWSTP